MQRFVILHCERYDHDICCKDLEKTINEHLGFGYELHGTTNVVVGFHHKIAMSQAMILSDKPSTEWSHPVDIEPYRKKAKADDSSKQMTFEDGTVLATCTD